MLVFCWYIRHFLKKTQLNFRNNLQTPLRRLQKKSVMRENVMKPILSIILKVSASWSYKKFTEIDLEV